MNAMIKILWMGGVFASIVSTLGFAKYADIAARDGFVFLGFANGILSIACFVLVVYCFLCFLSDD